MTAPSLHLSIVSHLQAALVERMLEDLSAFDLGDARITLLSNVPEPRPTIPAAIAARTEHITNDAPRGFGANHNAVFRRSQESFFCVLNPDLRFPKNPFPPLLEPFTDERMALVAPAAVDPSGALQDNARRVPTPWRLASKLWSGPQRPDYPETQSTIYPEWMAGFFLLFRSAAFRELGGFDERYFMYYEDMDLCCRLRLARWKIAWVPNVRIVHDARRRSHRDLRHMLWHLGSIARFFSSPVYRAARAAPGVRYSSPP